MKCSQFFCKNLLKRILFAAAIAIGLCALFVPINLWLLESINHLPTANREVADRNFVQGVINETLNIIIVAISIVILWSVVRLLKALPAIQSKEEFKNLHPSIPDHYLGEVDEEHGRK